MGETSYSPTCHAIAAGIIESSVQVTFVRGRNSWIEEGRKELIAGMGRTPNSACDFSLLFSQ
jgi:hypothetical protein